MRPKQPQAPSDDLFRSSLEAIIDPAHELIGLAALIDWGQFDDAFGTHYHEAKGRHGLPTRLMAGLHLLKHMKGLSDEETYATWLENPYFQAFCGETHFQHRLPFDRSSIARQAIARQSAEVMTRWRQRIGAGDLEALLAEMIAVAVKTRAVSERQLERITVDTTVQTMAIAHPTDSHLILRAIEWPPLDDCHAIVCQSGEQGGEAAWDQPAPVVLAAGDPGSARGCASVAYRRPQAGPALDPQDAHLARPVDPGYPPQDSRGPGPGDGVCHGAGTRRTHPGPATRRQGQALRPARARGRMHPLPGSRCVASMRGGKGV